MDPKSDVRKAASVARVNAMQELIRSLIRGENYSFGRNMPFYKHESGVMIDSRSSGLRRGRALEPHVFQVVIKSKTAREVWIRPGTIAGNIPLLSGVPLVALLDAEAPVLTLGTSAQCIYIQADANEDHLITSASIHSSNSAEAPGSTESTVYIPLASVTVDEGVLRAVSNTIGYSLGARWCNGFWDVYAGA